MVEWQSMIFGFLGQLGTIGLYLVYAVIGGAVVWTIYYFMSFKIKFRVKKLTGGKKVVIDTKAKRKIFRDGSSQLILRGFKSPAPEPPPECIQTTDKGGEMLEAYYNSTTREYVYINDDNEVSQRELEQIFTRTQGLSKEEQGAEFKRAKMISTLQPFTANDREFVVNNIIRAYNRKKVGWKENIPLIVGGAVLVCVLAVLLIFWGDAIKPMQATASTYKEITKDQKEIVAMLKETIKKEQIVSAPSQSIPSQVPE